MFVPIFLEYVPVFLFVFVVFFVSFLIYFISTLRAPNNPDVEKLSPYECGFNAFSNARIRFNIKFYLLSILFIIFDLESIFVFPWSLVLLKIGVFAFWSMMFFLLVLVVGFIYEWAKGALDW